jgi:hypothetical protein
MSGRPSSAAAGNVEVSGMGEPVGPERATPTKITRASLRTPRAAAFAGIAFSLILGTAQVLMRVAVPADPAGNSAWLEGVAQGHRPARALTGAVRRSRLPVVHRRGP